MQKIYLAGSCSSDDRTIMTRIANIVRKEGYDVYCPFELKIENAWDMSQEAWGQKVFEADIEAINGCDIFLMITPGRASTAGTNWEQGYAYAKNKRIVVIQYTNNDTSLMTYSAAHQFVLTNEISESALSKAIIAGLNSTHKNSCGTILT
jgi:nucleoside 2-deoxyribosyltransferase